MTRRAAIVLIALSIVTAVVAAVTVAASATGAAPGSTTVTTVKPVDQYQVLKSGWTVKHTFYGGSCSEGSEAVVGADRCFDGNYIYDPCWPTVNNHNRYNGSYCPSAPWSHSGVLIKGRHHVYNFATGRSVWGIALRTGNRCSFVGGATAVYRGKRLNFACAHDSIWLAGYPDKTAATWHILAVKIGKNFRIVRHWTADIRRAWVARSPYGG